MLQKTLWRMLFYILISYHHVCVMLPQTIVNDERENASLNQCTVGLYQRLGGGDILWQCLRLTRNIAIPLKTIQMVLCIQTL
jgi:hypothetical protein